MSVDRKRVLTLALEGLMAERSRVDAEIAELQAQLRTGRPPAKPAVRTVVKRRKAKAPAKAKAKVKTKKAKPAASLKGKRNRKTAASMKLLWEKARKAGFSNLKDYKASLNAQ